MTADNRPEPQLEPMPMDRAILWNPPAAPGSTNPGRPSSRSPYPIFFQQEAVVALQEHLKGSPQQAIFGFLIGHLYRDPEAGVLYTVIDKVLRLNQPVYGDKTEVVVSRLWDRMQQQLAKTTGLLLGWYHSHPGQGGFLSPHDIETHQKFFTEPWQVAVLVAAEAGGVTGRFFRFSQTADWYKTALPFYELLQADSIKPDGKKRSFITWRNYKAHGPTLTGPKPKPAPKAVAPPPPPEPEPAPEPEPEPEPEEASEPAPPPPPSPRASQTGADRGFRIMRSSADDIPVIKTSADDEPAPPPVPMAPPPPPPKPKPAPPPAPPPREPEPPPAPTPPPPPPPPPKRTSSDELPWAVTPESVASVPPPVLEPPAPPPPPRRRTSSGKFRLLDEAAEPEVKKKKPLKKRRRRGGWFGRIVLVLLLAAGGGGYWYLVMRPKGVPPPWIGLVDRVKKLVARAPAPPPPPPRQAARPRPAPAPPPAAAPPVDATWARFDRLSDTLSRAVRNFRDRAALFASGQIDCSGLATGLVAIENLWISYSTERRARVAAGGLDPRRTTQDQALYAGVDSVESRFEQSGCRRP